jgi:hypothetical protein
LLAQDRWFSPGTPASSTTKTGRHDIAEILLKVALNTKIQILIKSGWIKAILVAQTSPLSQVMPVFSTCEYNSNTYDVVGKNLNLNFGV